MLNDPETLIPPQPKESSKEPDKDRYNVAIISNEITIIDKFTFWNCGYNFEKILIGEGTKLSEIEYGTFFNKLKENLKELVIPIKKIKENFGFPINLEKVHILSSKFNFSCFDLEDAKGKTVKNISYPEFPDFEHFRQIVINLFRNINPRQPFSQNAAFVIEYMNVFLKSWMQMEITPFNEKDFEKNLIPDTAEKLTNDITEISKLYNDIDSIKKTLRMILFHILGRKTPNEVFYCTNAPQTPKKKIIVLNEEKEARSPQKKKPPQPSGMLLGSSSRTNSPRNPTQLFRFNTFSGTTSLRLGNKANSPRKILDSSKQHRTVTSRKEL